MIIINIIFNKIKFLLLINIVLLLILVIIISSSYHLIFQMIYLTFIIFDNMEDIGLIYRLI